MSNYLQESDLIKEKMYVWWIPQVPMQAFYFRVSSYEESLKIQDLLAQYDLFQYEQNVKGDYSNVGGVGSYNGGYLEEIDEDVLFECEDRNITLEQYITEYIEADYNGSD